MDGRQSRQRAACNRFAVLVDGDDDDSDDMTEHGHGAAEGGVWTSGLQCERGRVATSQMKERKHEEHEEDATEGRLRGKECEQRGRKSEQEARGEQRGGKTVRTSECEQRPRQECEQSDADSCMGAATCKMREQFTHHGGDAAQGSED